MSFSPAPLTMEDSAISPRAPRTAYRVVAARALAALLCLFFVSCSDDTDISGLTAYRWLLQSFEEGGVIVPALDGTEPTLIFSDDRAIGGSGGCNSFGGDCAVDDSDITISALWTTEMYCTTPGVMDQESRYYSALMAVHSWEVATDALILSYGTDGRLRFSATSLPAEQPAADGDTVVTSTQE